MQGHAAPPPAEAAGATGDTTTPQQAHPEPSGQQQQQQQADWQQQQQQPDATTAHPTRAQQQEALPEFLNLEELSGLAQSRMTKQAFDYFAGGSETQTTLAENTQVFADFRILPRILVDVSKVDTSTSFFGGS